MGTNVSRRPTSETCSAPAEAADGASLPWLESSISPEPEKSGEDADEEAASLHHTGLDISCADQHDKKQAAYEHAYAEVQSSPERGRHASSDRDTTPRIQATEPSHVPLFGPGGAHDLPLLRQESQDSAYASAMDNAYLGSIIDVDVQATNIRARKRVEMMRGRVLQTRRTISEKRQDLQLLRERLRSATDKLMRAVRELMVQNDTKNLRILEPQYQELSDAQDALGPAEYAYDLLETRLSHEEDELEDEEVNFYTRNNIRLAPPSDAKIEKILTPRIRPNQPELADLPNLNLEGQLERDYRTKFAEAETLKEQLHDLEDHQYELTEELAFRKRYDLQLSQEKTDLLFDFPKIHQQLVDRLEEVENQLDDLRDRCIKQNIFTELEYMYEPYDAFVEEIWESVNDARDRSPLYSHYIPHTVNFENKQDYVNTWLLESMHESTIETMQLKSFIHHEYQQCGREILEDNWSGMVLSFWNQDSAGEFANNVKRSTVNVLLGGTGSSLEFEDWGFERGPIVTARSPSPQQDVGIDLAQVDRVQPGQRPVRRRKRAPESKAHSV